MTFGLDAVAEVKIMFRLSLEKTKISRSPSEGWIRFEDKGREVRRRWFGQEAQLTQWTNDGEYGATREEEQRGVHRGG